MKRELFRIIIIKTFGLKKKLTTVIDRNSSTSPTCVCHLTNKYPLNLEKSGTVRIKRICEGRIRPAYCLDYFYFSKEVIVL